MAESRLRKTTVNCGFTFARFWSPHSSKYSIYFFLSAIYRKFCLQNYGFFSIYANPKATIQTIGNIFPTKCHRFSETKGDNNERSATGIYPMTLRQISFSPQFSLNRGGRLSRARSKALPFKRFSTVLPRRSDSLFLRTGLECQITFRDLDGASSLDSLRNLAHRCKPKKQ